MGAKINYNFSEKQQIAMKYIVLVSKYHKRGMPFSQIERVVSCLVDNYIGPTPDHLCTLSVSTLY